MKRVPDPEIIKRQILDTAMRLFYEKGYDETSLEDIARELNVVKSLCYRYYDSKQTLFNAVLDEYTRECCEEFVAVIRGRGVPLCGRLMKILSLLLRPKQNGRYHDFFHKTGNEAMHDRLAMSMCRYMIPYLAEELRLLSPDCAETCAHPEAAAHILMYALIGAWQENGETDDVKLHAFGQAAGALLSNGNAENIPDWTEQNGKGKI
jgi:AcrR family transcriptional regulator